MEDNGKPKITNSGLIEFSQSIFLGKETSKKLKKVRITYNGLCGIICNYALVEDMLGNNQLLPSAKDVKTKRLIDKQ